MNVTYGWVDKVIYFKNNVCTCSSEFYYSGDFDSSYYYFNVKHCICTIKCTVETKLRK